MFKQSLGAVLTVLIAVAAGAAMPDVRSPLIVHEWGTFTAVAGSDGRAVAWRPLDGAGDLPCFVQRADLPAKASFVTTVRMETPVIYFYSPTPLTVDVAVGFRNGLMTEFYPPPTSSGEYRPGLLRAPTMSRLEWNGVEVLPGGSAEFPSDGTTNHYYAARAAGAAPLQVGTEQEGFLFYRGVGGFELPLRATVNSDRGVDIANDGFDPIPALMVFENRGGRVGFSTSAWLGSQLTIPAVTLDASIASARAALLGMLINEGLYVQEAEAMIETWSETWFEEGTRVFYVVPRRLVDHTLPLNIQPVPAGIERVFIGRLEIATPELLDDLHDALTALDHKRLAAHGRFLEPFSRRILDRGLPAAERARLVTSVAAATEALQAPVASSCDAITLSRTR